MRTDGDTDARPFAGEIRRSLEQVLASSGFTAKRRGALLRYLVDQTLAGKTDSLSEYSIALDVFGKPASFDPRTESTIRAEMSRLRKSLAEYYHAEPADAWRFEFPARGYAPTFVRNREVTNGAPTGTQPETPVRASHWRWAGPLAALALISGPLALWRLHSAQPIVQSVIVLPFVNLTGDAGNDYLADGLTEGLTDALARVASLRVVARTSAFQFKGKATDIRQIGRAVNADAAIEGSLRKTQRGLLVTVQANRTADGYHILSREVQVAPQDEGRVQTDLLLPVLAALRPDARPANSRIPDRQAFDLVLRARALRGYGSADKFDREVSLLNQAIEDDPEYGDAYAELASAYSGAATNAFVDPLDASAKAKAAAARALALDPSSATAYGSEGYVDAMVLGDWKRGEEEIRNAVRLMPQDAASHQRLGLVLLVQGRFQPALAEVQIAAQLDPLVPATGASIGMVYFMQRRYPEALMEWRNLAALHPDALTLRELVGMALEALGNYPAAQQEYDAAAGQDRQGSELRTMHLLAVCGRSQDARRMLDKLKSAYPDAFLDFAATYGVLGDRDHAFRWLERAWERRSCWMLKVHPFLDPLRADPRYAEFLHRAGFL